MKITECRACGSSSLEPVIDMGEMAYCGTFVKPGEDVPRGKLELVRCTDCTLVQLTENFDLDLMYGPGYGYRSGLNAGMVNHLQGIVRGLLRDYRPAPGDLVVDIGSNDGTLLNAYPDTLRRMGVDPVAAHFSAFYDEGVGTIKEFFSAAVADWFKGEARIVTTIAMFYDLPDPVDFAINVNRMLAEDGVWVIEVGYLHSMLKDFSFDAICHEHMEYYSLGSLSRILHKAGFAVVDHLFTDTNGGSILVFAQKAQAAESFMYEQQQEAYLLSAFPHGVENRRKRVQDFLANYAQDGALVVGYGASTKGNCLLQYCGVTAEDLPAIGEINPEKFGKVTPGTNIPILPEADVKAMDPDAMLVLPWHFKKGIIAREAAYLERGGKLVFPLPALQIHAR